MSDFSQRPSQSFTATFLDRSEAARALQRLRDAGVPEGRLRLTGGVQGEFTVTAADLSEAQHEQARQALAGETHLARPERREDAAPTDPAHAPRAVQPGFADVRPGYVPEPTDTVAVDSAQHPEGVPEPRGRFEDQLDKLPEGDAGAAAGRARVTIISPKER